MSSDSNRPQGEGQPQSEEVFERYLSSLESGEAEDFEQVCARYPHLAVELESLHDGWLRARELLDQGLEQNESARRVPFVEQRVQPTETPGSDGAPAAFPSSLGRYEIIGFLGAGGMGRVYLARDPALDRRVALKLMRKELLADPQARKRFAREARSISRITHPGITVIYEVGTVEGEDYIALEHVEGRNLKHILEEGPLELARFCPLAIQLAEAIAYAHAKGVMHRDLKPSNIILSEDGQVKILDFGLAKLLDSPRASSLTSLSTGDLVIGTVGYMAPEQARGEAVDERADVFSLGCILYQMATGVPAFRGRTATQVLHALFTEEPPPPGALRPQCPVELSAILKRALQKEPQDRYRSMDELVDDLRELQGRSERGGLTARKRSGSPIPRLLPPVAGVLVLLLAILGLQLGGVFGGSSEVLSVAIPLFGLGEGMEDPGQLHRSLPMFTEKEIESSAGVTISNAWKLEGRLDAFMRESGATRREALLDLAREAGADVLAFGRLGPAETGLSVWLELLQVDPARLIDSAMWTIEPDAAPVDVALKLAEFIKSNLSSAEEEAGQRERLAAAFSNNSDAMQAFVRAEHLLDHGEFALAIEEYERAIGFDPNFARAYYRMSTPLRWEGRQLESVEAAEMAVRNLDSLSIPDQVVVTANLALMEGQFAAIVEEVEPLLERYPDNQDALYLLAEALTHSVSLSDLDGAIGYYQQLQEFEPTFHPLLNHLTLLYAFDGAFDRARAVLDECRTSDPGDVAQIEGMLLALEGECQRGFELAFENRAGTAKLYHFFLVWLAILAGELDLAAELDALVDPAKLPKSHALLGWRNRADLSVYRGHFEEAETQYGKLQAIAFAGEDGFTSQMPASGLHSLAELYSLAGRHEDARQAALDALGLFEDSPRSTYMAGLYALKAGDEEAAQEHLAELTRLLAGARSLGIEIYRKSLQAELHLHRGQAERARALFTEVLGSGDLLADWYGYTASPEAAIRDGLFRAQLSLGDEEGAIETLEGLIDSGFGYLNHPTLYVMAHFELGRLHSGRGAEDRGRGYLERFLEMWGDAEWQLPAVARARELLED